MNPLTEKDIEYDMLIKYFIKKYGNKFYSIEDLYGTAAEGLMKAVRSYKEDKGCKFKTFAFMCMRKHFISVLEKTRRIKRGSMTETISLDAPLRDSGDLSLGDLIEEEVLENREEIINYNKAMELIRLHLTKKEYKILELVIGGYSDGEISDIMGISHKEISDVRLNFKFNSKIIHICMTLDIKTVK